MSGERDYLHEPSMVEMSKAFEQALAQLNATRDQMAKIAQQMNDGALQGDGGKAFTDALTNKLMKKMERLGDKMGELKGDVDKAVQAMREAESRAQKRFT